MQNDETATRWFVAVHEDYKSLLQVVNVKITFKKEAVIAYKRSMLLLYTGHA
jgi:hypothetical protein